MEALAISHLTPCSPFMDVVFLFGHTIPFTTIVMLPIVLFTAKYLLVYFENKPLTKACLLSK
jgi:hypothetical protein